VFKFLPIISEIAAQAANPGSLRAAQIDALRLLQFAATAIARTDRVFCAALLGSLSPNAATSRVFTGTPPTPRVGLQCGTTAIPAIALFGDSRRL